MNISRSTSSKKNPKRLALNLLSSPVTTSNTSSKCNNQEPTIIMQYPIYYQEGPACILPNLYLGAHYNARNTAQLSRHQISCIINVAGEITLAPKQVEYHHLHWTHSQNNLARSEFGRAIEMIEAAHYQNQIVLVHCQQGIERSAALVLAFLIRSSHRMKKITAATTSSTAANHLASQNWSLNQALAFVQEKAPGIRPNMELLYQLREYEKQLLAACPQPQYQQQRQQSLQARTRRSGSVGCSKPSAAMAASSSLRTCTLLGRQQRPRSASLRETSLSASAISANNNEASVATRKMQIVPVLQQEKSRNKSVLALVCILVLLAAAVYQRKLKEYNHNTKTNWLLTITTYDMNNDITKNDSPNDTSHLNHIFLLKPVYTVF